MKKFLLLALVSFAFNDLLAQITLGPSPYSQDFNSIGTSLPLGITVRASSTATALGTVQAYSTAAIAWNNTTGAVKNFASATGLTSSTSSTLQNSATNRSLGIRQTGTLGDPGASFVVQLAKTSGLSNFKLSFNIQSLDVASPRLTTWRVDYGFGPTPSTFTAATATGTLTTGGSSFTNNTISVDFGSSLDNRPDDVWIRIVTLTASTGSGNRASSAIDDLSLTYNTGVTPTPSFSVNPTSVTFGNQALGTTSAVQSYTLNYANLDGSDVSVSTSAPFAISKSGAGPFTTNLTYTAAELSGTSIIIYSQFSPVATGLASGTITHIGGGVSGSTNVSLTGTGVNLTPVATDDTFSGSFGDVITGNVSSNDSDPQSLTLTYSKLSDPLEGTLTFNPDGTFSYQTVNGSASTQTFTYRVANTLGLSDDATATITLAEKSKIFISQYYEGTSVNKWIELTNPTDSPVNTGSPQLKLALYSISGDAGNIVITGSPTQVVNLGITIPAKSSVLIGNTGNGTEVPYLTASSAQQTSNSVINFNGNDGVALLDAASNIQDAFGTGVNAKDVSYVRNQDATTPSAIFISSDWTRTPLAIVQNAADLDDPNRLGVHVQPDLPLCATPTNQPTALLFSSIGTKTITLSFSPSSDASEYLIVRSLTNSLSGAPADGTIYNTGNALGGGVVAARIGSTSFIDSNLPSGTTFYYFIYALNSIDCDGGPKYLVTDPLSGSQATDPLPVCVTPVSQSTDFHISFSNYNVIQGTFTPASGVDEFLAVMSKDSTMSSLPLDQTIYSIGDSIGGGIVIKKGVQASFSRSGLLQNTDYFFFIFSVNSNCSGGPLYLTASPLIGRQKTGVLNNNSLNFYYGNLHSHSSYSDGNKDDTSKKPEDDYAFAKNSRKMDFLGISEHNHTQAGMRLANWAPGIQAAKNATTPDFVAMHGMEWGVISGGGHVVVYGIDSLIGWEPGEYQIFVQKSTYTGPSGLFHVINRHGLNAIATLAHPNTTDFNNVAASYDPLADSAVVGSALESGPAFSTNITYSDPPSSMNYLSYYNRMLSQGYHLGATLDHDNHNMTFGRHTRGRLVVLAPALTENDLLDAIKKMRFYASEDSAARITYTINNQLVGSVFSGNGMPHISVNSLTTSPVTSITIMRGTPGSGVFATPIASSLSGTISYSDSTLSHLSTGYYYADIVEADGSRIITSPIWYTRNDSIKSQQIITFNTLATSTYGDSDIDPAATSTNTSIPIVYTSSDTTVAKIIGNKVHIRKAGSIIITASQAGNNLFKPALPKTQTLIVLPKAVTVSIDSKTKEYGAADPELTYTFTPALVSGDLFTGTLTRVPGENVSSYLIKQGTLALSSNYNLTVDSAMLTITKRVVAAKADPKTKVFGTADPELTYSFAPALVGSDTFTGTLTRQPGENVGTYVISQGSLALSSNYVLTTDTSKFVITKKAQVITFSSISSKIFGDADFTLMATGGASGNPVTFTSSNSAVANVVNGNVHIVNAGTTVITASQAGNTNYSAATEVNQSLIVNKAAAIITLSNLSQIFDGMPKPVSVTTSPSGLSGVTVTYDGSVTVPSAVGTYSAIASLDNTNYVAAPASGTLTITQPLNLKIQYRNADGSLTNNEGKPYLKFFNTGSVAVPYNQLTARYWITPENFTGNLSTWIDYAQIGNSKVIMKYVTLSDPRVKALGYIEYSFTASAGSLAAGGNSGEIQSRYSNIDWSNFNEGNDYSIGTNTSYADNSLITLYRNGVLIWGTEPVAEVPIVSLKAFSQANSSGSNTISTTVDLHNEGNVSVDYKDVTARYWFTSDSNSPLNFWIDYAKVGNNAISGSFVSVNPMRTNANTYLELKVQPTASTFYPLSSTGSIQYRITKSDWSNFNQLNDYSYQTGGLTENSKITIYYKGQLVYGTEPTAGGTSSRTAGMPSDNEAKNFDDGESSASLVYPNPSSGNFTLQLSDQITGPYKVTIFNSVGQVVDAFTGEKVGSFRKNYELRLTQGMYIILVKWKDHDEHIKIVIN